MDDKESNEKIDLDLIKRMNDKAIESQFFTPDHVYIESSLIKDFNIGAIYVDYLFLKKDEQGFKDIQLKIDTFIDNYQKRLIDTVEPFFDSIGYDDRKIDDLLATPSLHDLIFIMSPNTRFIIYLIKHTILNRNNSRPAFRYQKETIGDNKFVLKAIDVTYHFNTYPLKLSDGLISKLSEELGESFGVNIGFMSKDPATFDRSDWDKWLSKIDCFYLDSIGRISNSSLFLEKQQNFEFVGSYFFARKRFERKISTLLKSIDLDAEIARATSVADFWCEFKWIDNNWLSLKEETDHLSMSEEQVYLFPEDIKPK